MPSSGPHLMGSLTIATKIEKDFSPLPSVSSGPGAGDDVCQLMKYRVPVLSTILFQRENGEAESYLFSFGTGIARTAGQATTQANRGALERIAVLGKSPDDFRQNCLSLLLKVTDERFRNGGVPFCQL